MTWLNKVLGRGSVHTMSTGKGVLPRIVMPGDYSSPVLLARGKWIVHQNRVGIIADVTSSGVVEIHYTGDAGETVAQGFAPVSETRLAKCSEIPSKRRPSAEVGRSLGYL